MSRIRIRSLVLVVVLSSLGIVGDGSNAIASGFINWPMYHNTLSHHSFKRAATAITPDNVNSLQLAWHWLPDAPTEPGQPNGLFASPTVFNGRVYIGGRSGEFYSLDLATGNVVWKRSLGWVTPKTCDYAQGIVSTAAVSKDPTTDKQAVYVAAGGTMWAFEARNGNLIWQTEIEHPSETANDYFIWSSPIVYNGRVYIGISSQCDFPLVRASIVSLDQATGAVLVRHYTVPEGYVGGSVLSTGAVDERGDVYFGTANAKGKQDAGEVVAWLRLDPITLETKDWWKVPLENRTYDPGNLGSPLLFRATIDGKDTMMVGSCDKDGIWYAFRRRNIAAGPVWTARIGIASSTPDSCLASSAYDGQRIFVAGNQTTINGETCGGSVRALNPADGSFIWELCTNYSFTAGPTLNGSDVLAVQEWGTGDRGRAGIYFIRASTGELLRKIALGNGFSQAVFADDYVFYVPTGGGVRAYKAPAAT